MRLLIQDVSKTYRDRDGQSVEALAGVTFTVEPEELVAVVGPSGCGKSTLLNMLAGLLAPTGGSVGFEGDLPITEKDLVDESFLRDALRDLK